MNNAREAIARLADLLSREHLAMGEFIAALAEFDRERGWLALGYSGLFPFLQRELRLSKASAFHRKTACELAQRFPEVLEHLRAGRLCLTVTAELGRVLTPENRDEVLPRFFGLSKQEAKEVAAAIAPAEAPPRRTVVTSVPAVHGLQVRLDEPAHSQRSASVPAPPAMAATQVMRPPAGAPAGDEGEAPCARSAERAAQAARPAIPSLSSEPLTSDLRRIHMTVSRRLLEKLDAGRAALSHSRPGASAEEILEAGLDLLLDRAAKRNGLVARPQQRQRPCGPRHIPAAVKREVWARDQGRCQFPVEGGGVCGATRQLELDHIRPRALGGPSTADNLRLTCAFHNIVAARRAFGDGWMDQFTKRARAAAPAQRPVGPGGAAGSGRR